ncbi:GIY-YIG nuclease family protein [Maribacter sp. 2307ULW6-5]|uniref:GIY-YIG nuclease family protein n=1 Tax=Maribacter sp. 2307ULW6-5 TaxID=3386275 RepID=UPI0039BD315C
MILSENVVPLRQSNGGLARLATRPNVPLGTGGERKLSSLVYQYVLYSDKFGRFYIGIANEIAARLEVHNLGQVKSTKAFKPWKIVHTEVFESKQEVRVREKYMKSAAGRRWRKKNIKTGD